jgi:hypothetical protein
LERKEGIVCLLGGVVVGDVISVAFRSGRGLS